MTGRALQRLWQSRPRLVPGHVWLAGAGPGDPGLLTLDALSALDQAEVLVHDALVDDRVLDLAGPETRRIFAGKRGGKPSAVQDDITATLIAQARAGRRVVRLKGGDPFVFGRGGEECTALAEAGIPFRVIPGVTAGLGGLAAAGIPATLRGANQAVVLATGHGAGRSGDADAVDWRLVARLNQPIVLYMAMHKLPIIRAQLLEGGLPGTTPAAVVVSACTPQQDVLVTRLDRVVEDAEAAGLQPPAIVAIGAIVRCREMLVQATGRLLAAAAE